jgi:hypothetical protein
VLRERGVGRGNLEGMEWKGREVKRTNCFGGDLRRVCDYGCGWKWRHLEGLRYEVVLRCFAVGF